MGIDTVVGEQLMLASKVKVSAVTQYPEVRAAPTILVEVLVNEEVDLCFSNFKHNYYKKQPPHRCSLRKNALIAVKPSTSTPPSNSSSLPADMSCNSTSHTRCNMCLLQLFQDARATLPCPFCKMPVKREDYMMKTKQELDYEKEIKIRARIHRMQDCIKTSYNEQREDFVSEEQWDAYLERIEDISKTYLNTVYNLVEGVDEEETELEVRNYETQNRIKINANHSKYEEQRRKEFEVLLQCDNELNTERFARRVDYSRLEKDLKVGERYFDEFVAEEGGSGIEGTKIMHLDTFRNMKMPRPVQDFHPVVKPPFDILTRAGGAGIAYQEQRGEEECLRGFLY